MFNFEDLNVGSDKIPFIKLMIFQIISPLSFQNIYQDSEKNYCTLYTKRFSIDYFNL